MNPYEDIEHRVLFAKSLDDAVAVLWELRSGGYAIWSDGTLCETKQLVATVDGLRIEVRPREHPPPHFHISGGDIDATFSLSDCSHLEGRINGRQRDLVMWWFKRSRPILIPAWNNTRPSDCPVGPVEE